MSTNLNIGLSSNGHRTLSRWVYSVTAFLPFDLNAVAVTSVSTMSYVAKGEKEYDATVAPLPTAKLHKIRITLTSSNVKNLEKCMSLFAHYVTPDEWLQNSFQ